MIWVGTAAGAAVGLYLGFEAGRVWARHTFGWAQRRRSMSQLKNDSVVSKQIAFGIMIALVLIVAVLMAMIERH